MLNNIAKFFLARQLRLPILGLLLTLGFVGEQTKLALSNQIPTASTSTTLATNFAGSVNESQTPLLSRLRQVREQRSLLRRIAVDSQIRDNTQQQQFTTLNTVPSQGRSKLVSSANLSKNVKTSPKTTALVTGSQGSTNSTRVGPRANFPTKDGIYLYGQSPKANQIGQGYVVFQKQQGRVTGALYMPQSEFSCFQGTIDQSGELAMTVAGSPGETGTNQIATANQLPNFSDDQMMSYAYSVALQDYHQLKTISTNDKRILQMCNESATAVYSKLAK
ncbi:MAG: hypothetical protein KME59_23665 [Trichormus sp. ATA11-4-KO1]|nr:hypothetical protein [Trichormus sp. ATA11-4-KO1]